MARFDKEIIEQIRNANDIVSVISEHVQLQRKGARYWGCCPFHNEKTPSFSVNPQQGLFHCFGCKAGGDVFKFVQEYDHVTFPEAVALLAQRAQITLPEYEFNPQAKAREQEKQRTYEILELAATFFHNCLTQTKFGAEGRAYLERRGLTEETIARFRLGFAPDGWDRLYKAFRQRGYTDQELLRAGVIRKGKKGFYDYFRNRVMFPICDGRGKVVAFGGRVLDDSIPKYLNSEESDLFNKGKLLFAFDKAVQTIRQTKQAILMEGYMDVIAAHQNGLTQVVASLGTALTSSQVNLLNRQAKDVVLSYDMDGAGRNAVMRAIGITHNSEFRVRILSMPDGKDPDEFIKKHGVQEFEKLVDQAVPAFTFIMNQALQQHDVYTQEGKLAILEAVFPFIAQHDSEVKRDGYIKELALQLRMDNRSMYRYFNEFKSKAGIRLAPAVRREQRVQENSDEDALVAMALSHPVAFQHVCYYVPDSDFTIELYPRMLAKAKDIVAQGQELSRATLEAVYDDAERERLYQILVLAQEWDERAFYGHMKRVRLDGLRHLYQKRSQEAAHLSQANNPDFIRVLQECQEIQKQIQEWSRRP